VTAARSLAAGTFTDRGPVRLVPDARRVVAQLFLPGQEGSAPGASRAAGVVDRCLALDEQQAGDLLAEIVASHGTRHRAFRELLEEHFAAVAHRIEGAAALSATRRQLIGAYFTQEYAVEAAALFNPSVVAHPVQDAGPGRLRIVMSARAVGEGHVSSLVFRTGTLDLGRPGAGPELVMDPVSPYATTGRLRTTLIEGTRLRHEAGLAGVDVESMEFVLDGLPPHFTTVELDLALDRLSAQKLTRIHTQETAGLLRRLAHAWYGIEFAPATELSERTLMPQIPAESHGVEDVRFVRFTEDDGTSTLLATYTAYDGRNVQVRRLETADFRSFRSSTLTGEAATNKGMALFPRRIAGRYLALSRWDRENITVASSADGHHWPEATVVQTPTQPWELIQLGNCGSPIETPAGWLVLTHGVGPMRRYSIGALLLDLDDPTRVIGQLRRPLHAPAEDERDGYVPNVVYSCGALLHGQTLLIPYGCSDSRITTTILDLRAVLDLLVPTVPTTGPPTNPERRHP